MASPVLDIAEVRKTYRGGAEALRGVSLRVSPGTVFGLLRPNGAGKSTLVKILTTIIRPTGCRGEMLGAPIGDKATLRRVGYLPEHARFPDYLTGEQVLTFSAGLCGLTARSVKNRCDELLERVGMGEWKKRRIGSYSKGMKQRVGIAQALINDPEVVFLDEPSDGVDPAGRRDLRLLLQDLRREGRTIFVNSHLLSELEMVCDQVAILSKGEVRAQGELKALTGDKTSYQIQFEGALSSSLQTQLESDHFDVEPGSITLATTRAGDVMPALDALRAEGLVILGLHQKSMSLEDLFLEVVGADTPGADRKPSFSNRT